MILSRANFSSGGTLLAKITEPQLIALRGDLTDAQQIQLAKGSRTTQVADFETVAMMAFAAILSSMLFRRVSLTRINGELVVANERARAQARFRSLVNSSSDVLVVMDSELKILF